MIHSLATLAPAIFSAADPYTMNYSTSSQGVPVPLLILYVVIALVSVVAMWNVFKKAGRPGWAAIIPVYNYYVLAEIAGRPGWFGIVAVLLAAIPFVGWIASIIMIALISIDVAKKFHKSTAFGIVGLLIFGVIGYLILGFGKAQYDASVVTGDKKVADTQYPQTNAPLANNPGTGSTAGAPLVNNPPQAPTPPQPPRDATDGTNPPTQV